MEGEKHRKRKRMRKVMRRRKRQEPVLRKSGRGGRGRRRTLRLCRLFRLRSVGISPPCGSALRGGGGSLTVSRMGRIRVFAALTK